MKQAKLTKTGATGTENGVRRSTLHREYKCPPASRPEISFLAYLPSDITLHPGHSCSLHFRLKRNKKSYLTFTARRPQNGPARKTRKKLPIVKAPATKEDQRQQPVEERSRKNPNYVILIVISSLKKDGDCNSYNYRLYFKRLQTIMNATADRNIYNCTL